MWSPMEACLPVAPIEVFINPLVGEPLQITVKQACSGLDLSTATAASLLVRRPSGNAVVWSATISEQSFIQLKLTHLFAAGDMSEVGYYVVVATLSFPTGPRRMLPRTLYGVDPFAVSIMRKC